VPPAHAGLISVLGIHFPNNSIILEQAKPMHQTVTNMHQS